VVSVADYPALVRQYINTVSSNLTAGFNFCPLSIDADAGNS